MSWQALDRAMDEFEQIVADQLRAVQAAPIGTVSWRHVWGKAREIQDGFKSRPNYPSRDQHQAAWKRFDALRLSASTVCDTEKEKLAADAVRLTAMIDKLESKILEKTDFFKFLNKGQHTTAPSVSALILHATSFRQNWSEVNELMHAIQTAFKATRYPTESERNEAWNKFCALRNEANAAKGQEREEYLRVSEIWRYWVLLKIDQGSYYNNEFFQIIEDLSGISHTAEDMKRLGEKLKEAKEFLDSGREHMTKDDKDVCYAKLREAWASHDYFWRRFKENKTERIRQTREEFERKRTTARQRIEANLGTNREKLAKAESAAARTRDNIVKLEDDIDNAYNDGFRIRAEGWLAEARERLESIEATVDRYQTWVQQDEERLRSF